MPRSCAATHPVLRKKRPHAQLSFFVWRRWRCGGGARGERYLPELIEVKSFVRRSMPLDPSRLTLRKKCNVICDCVRCLPAFNGAKIY